MSLLWDEIMSKSPAMKKLVEDKIAEEVGKKDVEIATLNEKLSLTQDAIDELILGGGL